MGTHIVNGEFQSDKYPTCPPGKVPLSVKDTTAQDLLWEYAQRRREINAEFSADLEIALINEGYVHDGTVCRRCDSSRSLHDNIPGVGLVCCMGLARFAPGRTETMPEHPEHPKHYPPGMGEESRRLHREYNILIKAQRNGVKNGADVVRLTDECAAKGIILIPGGENL